MKKILIIEDDPIVSHVYRSRLEKEGFQVQIESDGQAGFYSLYKSKPDALLLDLMLPKMNGLSLLKKIRAVPAFEHIPVLVLTNAYITNMIHEAFAAGASAVYNKSNVTPRQIIDVLGTLFCSQVDGSVREITSVPKTIPHTGTAVPSVKKSEDSKFQLELRASFIYSSPASAAEMRKLLQDISKGDEQSRASQVEQLYRQIRSFSSNAAMAGLSCIAKVGAATEALVKEMLDKPRNISASTLRTLAHAIDFLSELSTPFLPTDLADNPPIEILVVDDEVLSRRAIVFALEKAYLKGTPVEDPEAALAKAQTTKFDLMFLDVRMPGMDGFQLCDRLRESGPNKTTPIIFVTSATDFQARAQSTLRGAGDMIAKPFMFIELTVKALTFALRHRIETQKKLQIKSKGKLGLPAMESNEIIM